MRLSPLRVAVALCIVSPLGCEPPRTRAPVERHTVSPQRPAAPAAVEPQKAASEYDYEILEHSVPTEATRDSTLQFVVRVKNASTRTWPKNGQVKVGLYWLDEGNKRVESLEGRGVMPKDVDPGTSAVVRARVRTPQQPGQYRLVVDLVEEHVLWFSAKGSKPLRVNVRIR